MLCLYHPFDFHHLLDLVSYRIPSYTSHNIPRPKTTATPPSIMAAPPLWNRPHPFHFNNLPQQPVDMPRPDDTQLRHLESVFYKLCHPTEVFTSPTHVPIALNLYNNRTSAIRAQGAWVYCWQTLIEPHAAFVPPLTLQWPPRVLEDCQQPWITMAGTPLGQMVNRVQPVRLPRYRYVAWIFYHRGASRRHDVFSLVYWDREYNEMFWHDTYVSHPPASPNRRR